jgi:hypothetical protein
MPASTIPINASLRIPGGQPSRLRRIAVGFRGDGTRVQLKFFLSATNEPLTLELPQDEVWSLTEWLDNETTKQPCSQKNWKNSDGKLHKLDLIRTTRK